MSMTTIAGRTAEINLLRETLNSSKAEMVVVYGRRRVGKTFLVRTVYEKELALSLTGLNNGTLEQQLQNFASSLSKEMGSKMELAAPANWFEAFQMLESYLQPLIAKKKRVVFIDEFPWLDTPKSSFLTAFEHFWNSWASTQSNLKLVLCGSSASWMIRKIINNKGGLHNRITRKIRLLPFNLHEVEDFFKLKKVTLDRYQIVQLYMVMGGIPHYLNEIKPGQSAIQNIDRICFTKDGLLHDEYKNLYASLFNHPENHLAVIKVLAEQPTGLHRNDIIEKSGLSSGGGLSLILDELLESGFIAAYIPFQKKAKDMVYKLADEYSAFYLKYIRNARTTGAGTWQKISSSPSWRSWSGFAFESVCLKHVTQIRKTLGISGIYTEESIWRKNASKNSPGAQIDLLLDRADHCISACEIKFSNTEFTIDKKYIQELQSKTQTLQAESKTRKTILGVLITTFGVKNNEYKNQWVQNEVQMNDLFVRV